MAITLYHFDNILQVRCKGTIFGERFELLQHFRCKENARTKFDISGVVRADFLNRFAVLLCDSVKFDSIGVCRVRPGPKSFEEIVAITPLTGVNHSQCMPHQIAYLWKVRTALNAPAGKGRVYFPGIPQQNFQNGSWTQGAVTTMDAVRGDVETLLKAGGTAGTIEWGVCSFQTSDPAWNPMQSIEYSLYPATMRSRRPQQP